MGGKVPAIVLVPLLMVTITAAIKVSITDVWKPDFGWEVTCTWETPQNDTLQSVRLSNDGQQFMIFRPEKHGPSKTDVFRTPERMMVAECRLAEPGGQRGRCTVSVEPYQPPVNDFAVKCEVSGERPTFRIEEKEHIVKVLVPPSNATMVSNTKAEEESQSRVSLNCSSSGLPAPNLLWTVADDKVQADFTGRAWNATSKLWHVWSLLSYTRADHSAVRCSPEVIVHGDSVRGNPAEFSSASRFISTATVLLAAVLILQLLR